MRVNREAGVGSVSADTTQGSSVLGKEGGSLLWSFSPFPGEEVIVRRGELPAVPLLSEWLCLCWLLKALTCPSLTAISLTMSSLGTRQASSVTLGFCQMGALHSGCRMWPGLGSPAQQLYVQGSGRWTVLPGTCPAPAVPGGDGVVVPWPCSPPCRASAICAVPSDLPILGRVQVSSRSYSILLPTRSAAAPGTPRALCSLSLKQSPALAAGARCGATALPAQQPDLAELIPCLHGQVTVLPTQPSPCACQLSSLRDYLDFQLFPLPACAAWVLPKRPPLWLCMLHLWKGGMVFTSSLATSSPEVSAEGRA